MYSTTISCSVALVGIIIFLFSVRKNIIGLLKDESTVLTVIATRPYSLSRTLFFYWTVIILFSVCYIGIVKDNMVAIDSGVLILMGIVGGTTTTAAVIDTNQIQNPNITTRIQDSPTQGFFTDILSDGNGISISRLQTVAFNLIYGCCFLGFVFAQNVLYDFPPQTLTLTESPGRALKTNAGHGPWREMIYSSNVGVTEKLKLLARTKCGFPNFAGKLSSTRMVRLIPISCRTQVMLTSTPLRTTTRILPLSNKKRA